MQRAHSFGKIRYISALRVRRSWTRNRINYGDRGRGERDVFITCRIARAAVSREAKEKKVARQPFSAFEYRSIAKRERPVRDEERNDPKWRKNRNSRSELPGTRGGIRVKKKKKKFRESRADGAFSRNENVINRERGTCARVYIYVCVGGGGVSVAQISPARQGRKVFPMAFSAR